LLQCSKNGNKPFDIVDIFEQGNGKPLVICCR